MMDKPTIFPVGQGSSGSAAASFEKCCGEFLTLSQRQQRQGQLPDGQVGGVIAVTQQQIVLSARLLMDLTNSQQGKYL